MAKTQQPPSLFRVGNAVATALLRLGLPMGPMYLLTVRGRKSGQPRTTPLAVLELDGTRYILAVYGVSDWVRNLRAAGAATLSRGRHKEAITVTELPPKEAAVILKTTSGGGPGFLRNYFETTPASSLEEFEREALRHPVFRINPT
jgi:deazaflavin-dependent oxidoreductase (nitroreductase family)